MTEGQPIQRQSPQTTADDNTYFSLETITSGYKAVQEKDDRKIKKPLSVPNAQIMREKRRAEKEKRKTDIENMISQIVENN